MSEQVKTAKPKSFRLLLEDAFWLFGLEVRVPYFLEVVSTELADRLWVVIGPDGDVWCTTGRPLGSAMFRFRTFEGGGRSLRTRTALMILAYAIYLNHRPVDSLESTESGPQRFVEEMLATNFWIDGLLTGHCYSRLHDDHDGTLCGRLLIEFLTKDKVRISTDGSKGQWLEISRDQSSAEMTRIFSALVVLAYAIELDGKERPDPPVSEQEEVK